MAKDKALIDFFKTGRSVSFSKGEVILAGNDEDPDIHYVAAGFVKIYSINDQGENYVHIIYKKGDIFPLIWALKGRKRLVFYEALSDCTLLKVPRDRFTKYLKENSSPTSYAILEQLVEQFNVYADRIENLEYKSAYERVVYRLLFLAGRLGKKQGHKIVIDAPLTHRTIAESINLARESFSREFEKLAARGLVSTVDGRIVINDLKKLCGEFSEPVSLDFWGLQ